VAVAQLEPRQCERALDEREDAIGGPACPSRRVRAVRSCPGRRKAEQHERPVLVEQRHALGSRCRIERQNLQWLGLLSRGPALSAPGPVEKIVSITAAAAG